MKRPIIIGIAGPSGSGKSAVAAKLEERLDCRVFHSDGYFNDPLPTLVSPDDGETYPGLEPARLRLLVQTDRRHSKRGKGGQPPLYFGGRHAAVFHRGAAGAIGLARLCHGKN